MAELAFHLDLDIPTPLGLLEISGVPEDYIERIWLRIWPQLHFASSSDFPWEPTTSSVRLFNDIVRAVLHDNAPLPEFSEVANLVRDLLLFSLNVEAPVESEDDSSDSSSEGSDDADADDTDEEEEDPSDGTTEVGSRLPHSLQALQPVSFQPYQPVPEDIATINLDGEDIMIHESEMLDEFHIVEDNGEIHPLTEDELASHLENPDGNVRDVEIRRLPNIVNTESGDTYDRLSRVPADDIVPYEEDLETIPDWRGRHLRRLRRDEDLTADYCHCDRLYGQDNNEDLSRPFFPDGAAAELFSRRLRALERSEGSGRYPRVSTRDLLGQREARFLAGLDTGDMDREITRRILQSPDEFSVLREAMSGYLMDIHRYGDNYQLE